MGTQALARLALALAAIAQALFLLLGVLIPFTAGVSTVVMPLPILAFVVAVIIARAVRLPPADPLAPRVAALLVRARYVGFGALGLIAVMAVVIGIGVVLGISGLGPARRVLPPAGFAASASPPTEAEAFAANRRDGWRISLDSKTHTIVAEISAQRAIEQAVDGFVAIDKGEFGGSLSFDGHVLVSDNTLGVVRVGERWLSLHGLNHMGTRRGSVRVWKRAGETMELVSTHALDAGPDAYVATQGGAWIVTPSALWRVTPEHAEKRRDLDTGSLYSNSIVEDGLGGVYIGMRGYVVHVNERGAVLWYSKK